MQNHLKDQTSPYLLQHVNNPVDWYPWGEEAFEKAKREDKPIFLSIGYSTCHWCHVMAHESFEDEQIADILNKYFISIKVDKEERPDLDSIYMAVCQAFTGGGGWPTSIFLTPEQKPFFAGTYFPRTARYGQVGLKELLLIIREKWEADKETLLKSAEEIISILNKEAETVDSRQASPGHELIWTAVDIYKRTFDIQFGGFGEAPKFPTPHNLIFLMKYYEKSKNETVLKMVEKTLLQMYKGGMFDHIGGGFCRYSTDKYFLAPHFEKMLYDNALLILAYSKAYQITKKNIYRDVAEKTARYIIKEMTSPEGGFYSAQDADSEGVEGKYYLFEPEEIIRLLGEETGTKFNEYFDITDKGNFEEKNIPNLLKSKELSNEFDEYLGIVYGYRKGRYSLHLDDKILTAWNGLMIAAMSSLYRITQTQVYLDTAVKAQNFIEEQLCEEDTLYVSYREGNRRQKGFLDDYANEIFALLALYEATLDKSWLEKAKVFCRKAVADFYDEKQGGFFLYGEESEQLILRPKETYDGAVFSGNSSIAYNLVRLSMITEEQDFKERAKNQLGFMSKAAERYPAGHAMFLIALSDYFETPEKVVAVLKDKDSDKEKISELSFKVSLDAVVRILESPTGKYSLKNDKITFYVCKGQRCLPPVNKIEDAYKI